MTQIEELNLHSKRLVNKLHKSYHRYDAVLFSKDNLESIANEILINIEKKINNGTIDKLGSFNYFATVLKNKCIDQYRECQSLKRKCLMSNEDVHSFDFNKEESNPFVATELNDLLTHAKAILQKKDTILAKIFELQLEDYDYKEIMQKLNLSKSTFYRKTNEISNILEKHKINQLLNHSENDLTIFSNTTKVNNKPQEHIYKDIKFNVNNSFSSIKLILKNEDFETVLIEKKSKDNLEHIKNYKFISKCEKNDIKDLKKLYLIDNEK